MNGGITFQRGAARRPALEVSDPLMQWATGLPTTDQRVYSGWFIEAGQDADLDEAWRGAQPGRVDIKHGGGNVGHHWALPLAHLFVLCDGLQSRRELAATQDRHGIAYGWTTDEQGRPMSQLRCRVLVRELLAVGYDRPLLISLSSTITDDMLAALRRQYAVLDAAREAGKGDLPFYAFSLPVAQGQAARRGQQAGKQREIIPMHAPVPSPVTREYLVSSWIGKKAWVETCERLLPETIAWSVAESLAISAGTATA
jgi:hypothetical protein